MEKEISMMTTTDILYDISFFNHPNEITLKEA